MKKRRKANKPATASKPLFGKTNGDNTPKAEFTNWGYDGKRETFDIPRYIVHRLNMECDGVAESANEQALSVQRALGRLVEALVKKGVLDASDIMFIGGHKDDDVRIV